MGALQTLELVEGWKFRRWQLSEVLLYSTGTYRSLLVRIWVLISASGWLGSHSAASYRTNIMKGAVLREKVESPAAD